MWFFNTFTRLIFRISPSGWAIASWNGSDLWVYTSGTGIVSVTSSTSPITKLTFGFTGIIISTWTFTSWGRNSDIVTGNTFISVFTSGTVVGTTNTSVSVIEETIWTFTFWGSDSWWETFSTVISILVTMDTLVATWRASVKIMVTEVSFHGGTFWAS